MTISTQCLDCKHYTGLSTGNAFPEKIPQEIFDGTVEHVIPYPGDGGIMFEPIDTELSADQKLAVVSKLEDKGLLNKFEIPDEILEQAGIDPKKLSPDQLKAMFAKLAEKGLLKDKPGDKKSTGKGSDKPTTKDPEGASGSGRPGLVKKKVTVHRGGKTFEQERWVKAGEDEPVEKPKKGEEPTGEVPGKSPGELPSKPKGLIIQGLNKPDESTDEMGTSEKSKNQVLNAKSLKWQNTE